MTFEQHDLSSDGFLDGRLNFLQPKQGYRSAMDAVFLAAAVPAVAGNRVLELGCGAGVALGCLCARVDGLVAFGVELQPAYAELASQNFAHNNLSAQIFSGDLSQLPKPIKSQNFDHVLANPPYFAQNAHTPPDDAGKSTAHISAVTTIDIWVSTALRRLHQGGVLTMINRVEALPQILAALNGKAGDISVLPISARQNRPPRRIIVQAKKSARGPLCLLSALIVHSGADHGAADDGFTSRVSNILRHGGSLKISNNLPN